MNILVLDVGTSSMRGVLYGDDGKARFTHRVRYSVRARGGLVEQPASDWENAVTEICRRAAECGASVDALSLTSQRSSVIPVDRDGIPLRDAVMWQDVRSAPVVEELSAHAKRIQALTGARPNTVFSGPKMTWFRRAERDRYAGTYKLCTIADYLTRLFTGRFVTDETYGSRSLLMGLKSRRWEPELLALMDVEEEKLCTLIEPGGIAGLVTAEFAQKTGLPEGIPLISAGGDQQCGALGQGLLDGETLTVTLGTSACILKQTDSIPEKRGGVICGAHAIPGSYVLESSTLTCGAVFDWVRNMFFPAGGPAAVEEALTLSRPGAGGVTLIPYFQGRGTPDWNSAARGGFVGLDLGSTRSDMARAALESIAYEFVNCLEAVEAAGGPAKNIRVGGGLTQSPLLCGMLADASGRTVFRAGGGAEDTAFGAWMSAAVRLGSFNSYEEAFQTRTVSLEAYEPDKSNFEAYQKGRERMNRAYRALYEKHIECESI